MRVAAGVLSAGHARAILSVGDPDEMERLADKIVNEDLSVRAAEAARRDRSRKPARAKPGAGKRQGSLIEIADALGRPPQHPRQDHPRGQQGQIMIDFATVEDLNRILTELGEELDGCDVDRSQSRF